MEARQRPRGVVLIVVDTLRADHTVAGGPVATPSISMLAADGVSYPQAFSHAPATLPSHTAMFASRYPFSTGVLNNGQAVPRDVQLLAPWLARHGFKTHAAVALATLWPVGDDAGLDRGFDRFERDSDELAQAPAVEQRLLPLLDELASNPQPFFLFAHFADPHEPYDAHASQDPGADPIARSAWIELDGERLEQVSTSDMTVWSRSLPLKPGEHVLAVKSDHPFQMRRLALERLGASLSCEFELGGLRRSASEVRARFFIDGEKGSEQTAPCSISTWLHDVPSAREIPARYAREVAFVDAAVGRLLGELRARDLYDQSLVVFTSDHGEALGEHGAVGHIVNLYDELLHVPLIIKPPRDHRAHARLLEHADRLALHVDLVPTILDVIGLPALPGQVGRSLMAAGERTLLAETHPPEAPRRLLCLRDERYKLILDADSGRFEMYDLTIDKLELTDVYDELSGVRPDWSRALMRLAREHAAAPPAPPPSPERLAQLRALGYLESTSQ